MGDLHQRVGYTVMFLQMTVTEMHKLAEAIPEFARELGHIAEQGTFTVHQGKAWA